IIDKMEISKFDTNRWADYRLENMGIVFQDFQLLDVFTTYENIIFPSKILKKESNDIIKSKANTYIKMANLVREKNKNIRELSGGEKQRVAFIRAFMNNPKIILADEPTGSLDYKNSQILIDFISKSIKELGQTMIMVTHDSYVAANADKVYFLKDGQIISKLVLDKSSNERLNENIDLVQKELLKITT
ncbi:ABC transporter ATP-binding protein, partial [Streptococcus danieliae]|nr:ABC transporter ATP-binding protein [Streptococcus danieliae]